MRICTFCVMDETDPDILFDLDGRCNHCKKVQKLYSFTFKSNSEVKTFLKKIKRNVKRNAKYDCIIGLSGGVDSSYLLHLLKEWKLNPLVVHVDAGWNSIEAVENIQALVRKFDFDLKTVIIDWKEMRDLQKSFLRSGVMNQDVPQDHAFFCEIYNLAKAYKIKNVILGTNLFSESILPKSWGQPASDGKNIRRIFLAIQGRDLTKYKTYSLYWYLYNVEIKKNIRIFTPLNLINYDKDQAKQYLINQFGYRDYGNKHSESTFTSYYQKIYLPTRFEIDKRKAHLSSMIVSGQISRELAVKELKLEICSPIQQRDLRRFVSTKLGIEIDELAYLEKMPLVDYRKFGYSRTGIFYLKATQKMKILLNRANS